MEPSFAGEIPEQPQFGEAPVAFHRVDRNMQAGGCLFDGQAAEEA